MPVLRTGTEEEAGLRGSKSTTDLSPKTLGSSQITGSRSQQTNGGGRYLLHRSQAYNWEGSYLPLWATASPKSLCRNQQMPCKHLLHAGGLWPPFLGAIPMSNKLQGLPRLGYSFVLSY